MTESEAHARANPASDAAPAADPAVPLFVVSLARAAERRRAICEHLQHMGARFRLIDAVDGAALGKDEWRSVVDGNIPLHPGTVGCYLSHVRIYETMAAENIQVALVLEDDARLNPDVVHLLSIGLQSDEFDYCFLDGDDENEFDPIYFDPADRIQLAPGIAAHRLSAGPQTTHAYLITLPAAKRRLQAAFPIQKAIDLYDHLPYPIRFRAVVSPKLAWLSEHSLASFTSSKARGIASLKFQGLRRRPWFYRLRNWLKLKPIRRSLQIKKLVREGRLPAGRHWVPLPWGRDVLL